MDGRLCYIKQIPCVCRISSVRLRAGLLHGQGRRFESYIRYNMRKFTNNYIPVMSEKGARLLRLLTTDQIREALKTGKPIILKKD